MSMQQTPNRKSTLY